MNSEKEHGPLPISNGHQVAGRRNKSASEQLCKQLKTGHTSADISKGVQVRFRRLFVFATRRRCSRIFHPIVEFALSILCWQSIAVAQTQVHHHHGSEGIPPEVIEKLGTVQMPISCAASTSTTFERGVAMLHSLVRRGTKGVYVRSNDGPIMRHGAVGSCDDRMASILGRNARGSSA
jgi:hypothetical protein